MVQKYLSRPGGRFYCVYIDFRKAFDKINHDVLFKSLLSKGVKGKFYRFFTSKFSS